MNRMPSVAIVVALTALNGCSPKPPQPALETKPSPVAAAPTATPAALVPAHELVAATSEILAATVDPRHRNENRFQTTEGGLPDNWPKDMLTFADMTVVEVQTRDNGASIKAVLEVTGTEPGILERFRQAVQAKGFHLFPPKQNRLIAMRQEEGHSQITSIEVKETLPGERLRLVVTYAEKK